MNEPGFANGDLDATLAIWEDAANGNFKNPNLTQFMQQGIEAIRSEDPDNWIGIEPTSLINAFPYATDLMMEQLTDVREGPSRLLYAGHLYEPSVHEGTGYSTDSTYLADWEAFRTTEATALDSSLWIGEFGGTDGHVRQGHGGLGHMVVGPLVHHRLVGADHRYRGNHHQRAIAPTRPAQRDRRHAHVL